MTAPEQPLRELMPLVENLISVLIVSEHKSAELTTLLIWMNTHCNACGRVLTALVACSMSSQGRPRPSDRMRSRAIAATFAASGSAGSG